MTGNLGGYSTRACAEQAIKNPTVSRRPVGRVKLMDQRMMR